MRFFVGVTAALLAAALLLAGWDFARFVERADRGLTPDPPVNAQAVAVLTGRSNSRIVVAAQLADALSLPLLISGVNVDTSADDIARILKTNRAHIDCCVTLGKAAASTEGNGAEVASWARRRKISRIIVVTSEYHMERALMELQHALPEAVFLPHAVATMRVRPAEWWKDAGAARVLVEEWLKLRLAGLRNTATQPKEDVAS